ncbi:MAG: hypothetical protein MUO89_07100 [Dehalococcoidia bacterium]|nr:hypothetical protein [Dehalococcoidia bacterium]
MRIFLNVIGWIGVVIMGISLPLIYTCAGPNVGMISMCLGFFSLIGDLGMLLLLIGGFLSKWRYWWTVAMVIGVAYIVASIPGIYTNEAYDAARCAEYQLTYRPDYFFCSIVLIPGLACIIGGVIMKWLLGRRKVQ